MKTRISFVSNSSSSSFVVIGKPVGNLFYDDIELDENRVYVMRGKCMCDGDDIITMDKKTAKWFKEHYFKDDREFLSEIRGDVIDVTYSFVDSNGEPLPKIEDGNRLWMFEIDHHSTNGLKGAQYNYPEKTRK